VFDHIGENAREKGVYLDMIGGYEDHVHALVSLGSEQTIAKVVQLIKGESSHWINKHSLTKGTFEWQDEYFCVSVSESVLESVRAYIRGQEEHHRKKSFGEEYQSLLKENGFTDGGLKSV
jgi:REP element-mobilizing transposase RayT